MTHLFSANLASPLPTQVNLETSSNLADHRLPQSQVVPPASGAKKFDVCHLPFIGRTLNPWLNMALHDLSALRISDEFVDAMRLEGDPLCDTAVEALFENGVPVYSLMHLDVGEKQTTHMAAWGFCVPPEERNHQGEAGEPKRTLAEVCLDLEHKDPRVKALISSMLELPDFGDLGNFADVVSAGKQLYQRNWLLTGILLAFRSLFMAYLMPKGMEVLINYGSNLSGPNDFKRLMHTTYWSHLMTALDDDGTTRDSRSFQAILHVRLMHSAIRRYLLANGVREDVPAEAAAPAGGSECPYGSPKRQRGPWRTGKVGIPINQEDMVGTIFLFSIFVIEGFLQAGIEVSMHDAECSYALWRWVGMRLGCLPKNLPTTVFDAIILGHKIADRSFAVADNLILYTDAMIKQMCTILPLSEGICSAIVQKYSGEDMRQLTRLRTPSIVDRALVSVTSYLMCVADVVQRKVPGAFALAYKMKRPVHRFYFYRAVRLAGAARSKMKKGDETKASLPSSSTLASRIWSLVAFVLVTAGSDLLLNKTSSLRYVWWSST